MKKLHHILLLLFAVSYLAIEKCHAQAYQFSQFYAAPTFINPAFVGTGVCSRLSSNYRIQWPSIPGAYKTYLLAYDRNVEKIKSGFGFIFASDDAGSGNLRSTSIAAQYAYHLTISRVWTLNAGFEAGLTMRSYDFSKFIFGDQIAYGTPTSAVVQQNLNPVHYPDISSGLLLYSSSSWFGFSAKDLNQPNQSLIGEDVSRLPTLYSLHGGWVIPITNKDDIGKTDNVNTPKQHHSITAAFNVRAQGKFVQMDIGAYYTYYQLVLGVWYRGIPVLEAYQPGYQNNDAIVFLVGVEAGRFKFGYSYDVTISLLAGYTDGANELSVSYQFCDPKKTRKSAIPCPKF